MLPQGQPSFRTQQYSRFTKAASTRVLHSESFADAERSYAQMWMRSISSSEISSFSRL